MIKVQYYKPSDIRFPLAMNGLPVFMQNEIREYRKEEDRQKRIAARLMLKSRLAADGLDPILGNWQRDEAFRPFIENWRTFSISYSKNVVLFADAEEDFGIDIEYHQEVDAAALSGFFTEEERHFILSGVTSEMQDRFYEIWVKKEAILKALGVGIVAGLDTFSCLEDSVHLEGCTWFFYPLDFGDAYTAYLCSRQEKANIVLTRFAPTQAD